MTNMLYPESLVSNVADDVIKLDADMRILEVERYLDTFRMVDYSICGIELDKEKPYRGWLLGESCWTSFRSLFHSENGNNIVKMKIKYIKIADDMVYLLQ